MTYKNQKIIAIVPAYNEEATIGSVVLTAKNYVDKVVIVDDGSSDKTSAIAELAGAEVARHDENMGYGAAIKTCFDVAKKYNADVMVTLDGDGQHNPSEITKVVKSIINGEADIVIGSRFLGKSSRIPGYRKFGIKFLNRMTNLSSRKVSDTQSGFRAYSRKAINSLRLNESGMGIGSEILMNAQKLDLKIEEVPISVRYDVSKPSQHPLSHGASVLGTVLSYIEEKRPLEFFGLIGILCLTSGVGLGFWVFQRYNEVHQLATGSAVITAILVLTGILSIFSGIIIHTIVSSLRIKE
ncbi:MAG: glycosyltransferase family 2 protein [Candidatus Altiarchaeota archaeon]|nr:glycosyltransferase family 2 protein [Candidatus Altiarchaeota archaeon]